MKILIISDAWHPQVNGVVRTYEYLMTELRDMGYEVKVIGPADFKWTMPMPGYAEIKLALFAAGELGRQIDAFAPGVLHIATEGPLGQAARKYAEKNGVEFTSCYHTHFPDYTAKRAAKYLPFLYKPVHRLSVAYVKRFHKFSSCLFVATQSLKDNLTAWGFTCPMKFMTRGVDLTVFHPGEQPLFTGLPRPVALYVGRVAIEKNLPDFLDMEWTGSKVIVGDGPDMEMLKSRYPTAVFTGKKTGRDLADHYRSADIFVFPSRTDTFGMVLIEALACGLPLAAYPVTGPVDIITSPELGALNENLAHAARMALSSPATAQTRHEFVKGHYSWRKAAEQFLETD